MESSALCRLSLHLQTSKHFPKDSFSGIIKALKPERWQMPKGFIYVLVKFSPYFKMYVHDSSQHLLRQESTTSVTEFTYVFCAAKEFQPRQDKGQRGLIYTMSKIKCYDVFQTLSCSSLSTDLIAVTQRRSNLKCLLSNVEEDWIRDLRTK